MPAATRVSVFCATSVDGFIARPGGGIDWLGDGPPEGEDFGWAAFIASVDVLVMGRNTFETVLTLGEWPYGDTRVVVLSTALSAVPEHLADRVEIIAAPPAEVIATLADQRAAHIYVDGGVTIQAFIAAGLVDRLVLNWIPILLGEGIPLFGPVPADVRLTLVESKAFPDGLVQTTYAVADRSP